MKTAGHFGDAKTDVEVRALDEGVAIWLGRHGILIDPAKCRELAESLLLGAQLVERGMATSFCRLEAFMARAGQRPGAR